MTRPMNTPLVQSMRDFILSKSGSGCPFVPLSSGVLYFVTDAWCLVQWTALNISRKAARLKVQPRTSAQQLLRPLAVLLHLCMAPLHALTFIYQVWTLLQPFWYTSSCCNLQVVTIMQRLQNKTVWLHLSSVTYAPFTAWHTPVWTVLVHNSALLMTLSLTCSITAVPWASTMGAR